MRRRHELINYLIQKNNYKSYLEIGVEDPSINYDRIKIDNKVCVDPAFKKFPLGFSFSGTSDEFFMQNEYKFDIIFIDGLHEAAQAYKDIENSLKALAADGIIVMHDCLPRREREQIVPRIQDAWTGDVWKAFVRFREKNPYVEMRVVNMDMGMGVLNRSCKKHIFKAGHDLSYLNFTKYYKSWMNVISVEEFLKEDFCGQTNFKVL